MLKVNFSRTGIVLFVAVVAVVFIVAETDQLVVDMKRQLAAVSVFVAPVLHYTFDTTDINWSTLTVLDKSGNNYHNALKNIPSTSAVAGKIGQALELDGVNDYVDVPTALSVPFGAVDYVGTIAFWAKGGAGEPVAINRTDSLQGGYAVLRVGQNFSYINCDLTTTPWCTEIKSSTPINNAEWNHFAFTSDGAGNYKLAVNGQVTSLYKKFNVISGSYSQIKIGLSHNHIWGDAYFKGALDDIRIYNRALTETEIKDLAGVVETQTVTTVTSVSDTTSPPPTPIPTSAPTPIITGTTGIRSVVTTGSINAGSNQLTLPSAAGFNVGDWVIVEIGKEPGQGQRGTRGVGGTWPAKSYPTEAQVYADKNNGNQTFVWAEDTGYVFRWTDGTWYPYAPEKPNHWATGYWYIGKAIPRSLQTKITAINGSTLTLDKNAVVGVTGANVYLDTAPIITDLINKNTSLALPAGNFPIGGVVWIENKTGFTLSGAGKDSTRIYSPKGVPGASIEMYQSPNATVKNMTLESNWGDYGFGLNWTGSTPAGSFQPVTEAVLPQGPAWPRGIFFNVGSNNSTVLDARVINVSQIAAGALYAENVWARRIENIQTNIPRMYLQWQFQWNATLGGGCEDCEVRSTYLIPGFEAFNNAGNTQFIRPKGTNATMAINGSGGFLIEDAYLRFTANSMHPESDPLSISTYGSPVINVNTNIGVRPWVASGGTIRNMTMIQEGYINAKGDSIMGILIGDNNPNIRVEGGWYQAPDYKSTSTGPGAVGLLSTGYSTLVDGLKVLGKSSNSGPNLNIFLQKGDITLKNCIAETSWPPGRCQTPAQAGIVPIGSTSDITPPSVSLTTPSSGTSITAGTSVTLSANASDNVGVAGVQFKVDGINVGAEDTSAPYSTDWNTTGVSVGSHTLSAVARDAAGNISNATNVTVTVSSLVPTYSLTLSTTGTGQGTVSGVGSYASGAAVTLSATAASGSTFSSWSPSPCAPSFTMPASALTCTATFTLNTTPIVTGTTGIRSVITTGSINANSNQLTVASTPGFNVGDWVIVEIGKEPGQGQRGTRGVGGTWPARSYATEAQLLADKTLPNKTFVWAEDTGYVFWWIDLDTNPNTPPIWYSMAREKPNHFYTGYYYIGKVIPRSLQARILAKSGNTLTLDKSAAVSVSGANVYLDTAPIITDLINKNATVALPEGNFPTGGVVWIKNKQGFTLAGQGKDKTRIYSPKGVPGASIEAYQSPGTTVHSLTLESNWGDHGFGLNWVGSTEPGSFKPVTETDTPQGAAFPVGIYFNYGSSNSEARDARIINVAQVAAGTSFTTNVWGRRLENIQTNVPRDYIQWQYKWADTDKGGCEDCEIRSTYIIPGFSGFKASNIQFIRPKGTNAVVAMNDVGGFLIQDANLRFTANSLHPQSDPIAMSAVGSPVININTNIGSNFAAPGGTIRNATIIQEGYVNANNDTLRGIVVNENNPNIRIEGGWYQAPDYKSGSATGGAVGLDSTGPGTYVDGLKVLGKSSNAGPNLNIFMQKAGTLTNCVAETSWPPGRCQTPAQAGIVPITGTTPLPTPTPTPTPTASPNGTRGNTVIDSDGVTWSIDANKNVLRNGVPFNGGWASELLWWNGVVYHKGVGTKEWYTWTNNTWLSHGLADPQTGATSGDTTSPTISLTSPFSGTTVSGTVSISATASDNVGVAGVQFLLDGRKLGGDDTTSPYSVVWDTSSAAPGSHTLAAEAKDAAGNTRTSAAVTVTVVSPAQRRLITDRAARAELPLDKPAYLESVIDPVFGTKITRITGDPGTAIPNTGGSWGDIAAHNYAKDPVWSADGKLMILKYVSPPLFIDGDTYQPLFQKSPLGTESRWHPTLPDTMVYVTASGQVGHWNPRTNASAIKFDPGAGYRDAGMGPWEGNLSADGNRLVVHATRASDGKLVAFAVDIDARQKYPDLDANVLAPGMDWVSISPSGQYIVMDASNVRVFSLAGAPVASWQSMGHSDMGYDAAGNEIYFGSDTDTGERIYRNLSTGAKTILRTGNFDYHTSTRNLSRLGWGYTSQTLTGSRDNTLSGEIFAEELKAGGGIERFVHFRSKHTDYETAPFPVPSPDGKRVIFRSNWNSSPGRPVQSYVLDVRDISPGGATGISKYAVAVESKGQGTGTVSGAGTFTEGSTVTLTAAAASDSTFIGWSPEPCSPSFTMPGRPLTCSAHFNKTQTINTQGGGSGGGGGSSGSSGGGGGGGSYVYAGSGGSTGLTTNGGGSGGSSSGVGGSTASVSSNTAVVSSSDSTQRTPAIKFTANLKQGSSGSDVEKLQKVLGVQPTGFFGPLTRTAVEKFQLEQGIAKKGDAGFGQLGPLTRAKVQAVFNTAQVPALVVPSSTTTVTPPSTSASVTTQSITTNLYTGLRNTQIQKLQQLLVTLGYLKPVNTTGFYGTLTEAAVKKFQCDNNIVCTGSPSSTGWGAAGPKTRNKLNALY